MSCPDCEKLREEIAALNKELRQFEPMSREDVQEASLHIPKQLAIRFKAQLDVAMNILTSIRAVSGDFLPTTLRKRMTHGLEALWDLDSMLTKASRREDRQSN